MIVLDANILMRAVLGKKAKALILQYGDRVVLVAPDAAVEEARQHLPGVIARRGLVADPFLEYFASLEKVVRVIEAEDYSEFEPVARQRLAERDEKDWPVLAAAMALGCPIWTEDADFFGCGVATWTTDRVEAYLAKLASGEDA
jgi:predicted nucleic acid-binding protein